MKCFDAVLFVSQYQTWISKNGFLGGIMTDISSSGGFNLIIKVVLKRILYYD